jgi:hypothetical protein
MPDGAALIIGNNNDGTQATTLVRGGAPVTVAFNVLNNDGIAIEGDSEWERGIFGTSRMAVAVHGASDEAPGVFGDSGQDVGVFGRTAGTNRAGVFGGTATESVGVWGEVSGGPGTWPGVEGFSRTGNGVRGVSVAPAAPSSVGVVGFSTSGIGVVGITSSPSSYGGYFIGGLINSGGPKSAAVPHPDGSHRLLYSMESPESWFEDFGRAKLVRGKAKVKLEATFAAVVRTDDYHVFLTPEGETNGLHVSGRNRVGFEVREHRGGTSNATFSYRIVARRKDIKAPRLPKIVLPSYDIKDLQRTPTAVKLPKITKAREVRRKR